MVVVSSRSTVSRLIYLSQLKHRKEIIVVELLLVIWSMREQALETRLIDDKITKHTLRNLWGWVFESFTIPKVTVVGQKPGHFKYTKIYCVSCWKFLSYQKPKVELPPLAKELTIKLTRIIGLGPGLCARVGQDKEIKECPKF